MFIEAAELNTHLRGEQLAAIARDDETIVTSAIDGAIAETKGYLSVFDTDVIFGKTGKERHPLLLIMVKDIAVWHFINLCNVGSQFELRKSRYERAIKWLEGVQKGIIIPDMPLKTNTDGTASITVVKFGGNLKRIQHF